MVTAMPSFLNWSDFGMSSAAMNDMSVLGSQNRWTEAARVFQTNIAFQLSVAASGFVAFAGAIAIFPARWLPHISGGVKEVLTLLAGYLAMGILTNGLAAGYRAQQKYARWIGLQNAIKVGDLAATAGLLAFGFREVGIAVGLLANRAVWLGIAAIDFRRNCHDLPIGIGQANWRDLRRLWHPAIGHMCFPIGQSLGIQGATVAVGYVLSPSAVAVYAIARTYGRALLQVTGILNVVAWPEFSYALGSNDLSLARKIYRRLQQATVLMILAGFLVMWPLGPWAIRFWTHGRIIVGLGLVGAHLTLAALNLAWNSSHIVMVSVNQVLVLGLRYVVSTALALGAMALVARSRDLTVATLVLGLADISMCFYCWPASRRILAEGISGPKVTGLEAAIEGA